MKKIFIFLIVFGFFTGSLYAEEENEIPNIFGLGILVYDNPYKAMDSRIIPVPIISWENEKFFVDGLKVGVEIAEYEGMSEEVDFSLYLKPRLMGFKDGDSHSFNGMSDRDPSIDIGAEFSWEVSALNNADLSASFAGDLCSKHKGYEISLALSKQFDFKPLFIKPSIRLEWQSDEMIEYYYGVKSSEATALRLAYSPDSTLNINPQINVYLALCEEWLVVAILSLNILGNEIRNSPIVNESTSVSGVIGLARMF